MSASQNLVRLPGCEQCEESLLARSKQVSLKPLSLSEARLFNLANSYTVEMVRPQKKVGMCGATFTLLQTIVGSGILALPFAFSNTGIVQGFILMVAMSMFNLYCALIIAKVSTHINADYKTLTAVILGEKIASLLSIGLLFNCYFAVVVYLNIIKDILPEAIIGIFGEQGVPSLLQSPKFWAVFITLGVFFPLALLKQIKSIQYLAWVGFYAILYFVVLVVVEFFFIVPISQRSHNLEKTLSFDHSVTQILSSVPIIFYGLGFQFVIPSVNQSLAHRSYYRIGSSILIALSLATVLYFLFAVFGYLTEANQTQVSKNILTASVYKDRTEFNIGFLAYVMMILMTGTILFKFGKEQTHKFLFKDSQFKGCHNFWITLTLILICLALVLLVPQITVVMQFMGCTVQPFTCQAIPILYELKLHQGSYSCRTITACLMLTVLAFVSMFALASTCYELLS